MIGYRNHEKPTETDAFLPEEIEVRQKIEQANKDIHDIRNKIHTMELRKGLLQMKCPHTVFVDKYDDPHDHRVCVICGKSLGMI